MCTITHFDNMQACASNSNDRSLSGHGSEISAGHAVGYTAALLHAPQVTDLPGSAMI